VPIQYGAYNSGTEANFCTLKTAVEPEEDGLQDIMLDLDFRPVNTVSAFICPSIKISRFLHFSKNFLR